MDEQLKKTEEVTTDVLLEYLSVESASDRSSSGGNTQNPSKSRSRTASVQKAKALLRGNRTSHREHSRSTLKHTDCTQPEASDPANQTQDEELTSEGFVIVSNSPVVVPAPCSPAIRGQGSCQSRHLSTATCGKTLKRSDSSVKRPDTLSLQPSKDPGDPPLFSPNTSEIAQSYPPCGAGLVKMTSYLSSPVLTKSCSPTSARASVHPQSCMKQSSTSDHIQQQRHCCALPPDLTSSTDDTRRVRSRYIAEQLKIIGDKIDKDHQKHNTEAKLYSLMSSLQISMSSGWTLNNLSSWQRVTELFRYLYRLISVLNSQFGDNPPPQSDDRWQLFLKTMDFLSKEIIPWISTNGGWAGFLIATAAEPIVGSPQVSRHAPVRSTDLSIPTTHSTPILPQCGARLLQAVSPRTPASPYSRVFQGNIECQNSPGSSRALRIARSQTLPINNCGSQPKLWRLSESGSLVDEEGDENSFTQSYENVTEPGESGLSLENIQLIETSSQLSDSDQEMVFSVDEELPTTPPTTRIRLADVPQHTRRITSTPVITSSGHSQENQESSEYLCDSGIVSSLETLSLSSTPPQEVVFAIGNTQLQSHSPFSDSAVDVSSPSTSHLAASPSVSGGKTNQKRRPRSGCSFKEDVTPFDWERSRSVPMSRRPKSAGNEKGQGPYGSFRNRRGRERQAVVVSSSPPCGTSYSGGSVSLSLSAAVLYEAVCSVLRS